MCPLLRRRNCDELWRPAACRIGCSGRLPSALVRIDQLRNENRFCDARTSGVRAPQLRRFANCIKGRASCVVPRTCVSYSPAGIERRSSRQSVLVFGADFFSRFEGTEIRGEAETLSNQSVAAAFESLSPLLSLQTAHTRGQLNCLGTGCSSTPLGRKLTTLHQYRGPEFLAGLLRDSVQCRCDSS